MTDPSAEQTVRGILARTHTSSQIDLLITRLRAQHQPTGIYAELAAERGRQEDKFGPQNHPDQHFKDGDYRYVQRALEHTRQVNADPQTLTWFGILLEEVYETALAPGFKELREELVQVAAVAVAWIEALDRRGTIPPQLWESMPYAVAGEPITPEHLAVLRVAGLVDVDTPGLTITAAMVNHALDRLHATMAHLRTPAAQHPAAAPARPTPQLIRDLVEGARVQGAHCTEQTRLRNGTTVACTKQADHASPWHRRGAHSWKVVFGDAHPPRVPAGQAANRAADELGRLRTLARDWRTTLQTIAQQCRTCCTACDTAEAALAQHPATERL